MAAKKKTMSASEDARRGRARFVDQKGQWKSTATPAFKKKKDKEWAKLETMMKKGKKK